MQLQQKETPRGKSEAPAVPPDLQRLRDEAGALLAEFQSKLDQTLRVFKLKAAKQVAQDLPGIAERLIEQYTKQHEKLAADIAENLNAVANGAVNAAREAVSAELPAARQEALEAFLADAKKVSAKIASEVASAVGEHQESLAAKTADALKAVRSGGDEALRALQSALDKAESLAAAQQQQWNELAASGLKDLALKAEASVEACRERFASSLREFAQRATAEIEQDFAKTARDLLEHSASEMRRQTDAVRENLIGELRSSGNTVLEETQRKFAALETASSQALNRSAKTAAENAVADAVRKTEDQAQAEIARAADIAVARLTAERDKLLSEADRAASDHQRRLNEMSHGSLESLRRQFEGERDTLLGRIQSDADALGKRTLERAAQDFPLVIESLAGKTAAGFEKRASELLEQSKQQVQVAAAGAAEKIRQRFSQEAEAALRSASESVLEQSRAQLNHLSKDISGAARKQFEAEVEQSFRKQRRSVQAQIDEMARASFEQLRQVDAQAGVAPGRTPLRAHILLIAVAFIPTILFAYLATRPVMRLKGAAPADFLDAYPEWAAKHPSTTVRLGQAYWDWAALHLVPDYPYGSKLPEQPPESFAVEGSNFPTGVDSDVARMRYWQRLRTLWVEPQSWQRVELWSAHR